MPFENNRIVSVVPCEDYEPQDVRDAMRAVLEPLGTMRTFVKPGQHVALKLNLLQGAAPDKCVTTHPAVVLAAAELVREAGGEPFIIDSPGSAIPYKKTALLRVYEKSGLLHLGVPLNTDAEYIYLSLPDARIAKRIEVIKPLLDADVIISLPKVKTHSFMILTCAVKNMFGAIPGFLKVGYHSKLKTPERFAAMLLDVVEKVPPALTIVDGIRGMEGDGPSGGKPKNLGVLLASADPILADLVICRLIKFPPEKVPYLAIAQSEGLCPRDFSGIEVRAPVSVESLEKKFEPPATIYGGSGIGPFALVHRVLSPLVNYALTLCPVVDGEACIGCGACVRACPEKIIELRQNKNGEKKAHIGRKGCIRCYCCHEMCPHNAVRLHKSFLYRLLNRSER